MIIVRNLIVDMKEEIFNPVFGKLSASENAHDGSVDLKVVLYDADEAIGDDGRMNLDAYGILGHVIV